MTHSKVTADDWPLIQPSEVQVAVPPVLTAESKLTPLGMTLHIAHFVYIFTSILLIVVNRLDKNCA